MKDKTVQLQVDLPEDVYRSLRASGLGREKLSQLARQLLAIHLFQERRLSMGKAAKLTGLDLWRFIDLLGAHGVPVIDMDEEEFAEEMEAVEALAESLRKREDT